MRFPIFLSLAVLLACSGAALAADGSALYASNCASCHGADGKADSPAAKAMNVPALKPMPAEALAKYLESNATHKAIAAKLSADEVSAIAGALPQ